MRCGGGARLPPRGAVDAERRARPRSDEEAREHAADERAQRHRRPHKVLLHEGVDARVVDEEGPRVARRAREVLAVERDLGVRKLVEEAHEHVDEAEEAEAARAEAAAAARREAARDGAERLQRGGDERAEAERAERGGERALERARRRVGRDARRQEVPGADGAGDGGVNDGADELGGPAVREQQEEHHRRLVEVERRAVGELRRRIAPNCAELRALRAWDRRVAV